ncbi:hypothetical protein O6H91_11G039600 [Diphasiastrum complanatum]|uniref:Uncharacterized protein n=1 Tax=Diphasiastrum complanatum TaxID=34168 RepID=A0ACC2C8C0_DIPCM|nr:hypothetical protein O6H91_11G039600 [Diphasiastrum complanatum]
MSGGNFVRASMWRAWAAYQPWHPVGLGGDKVLLARLPARPFVRKLSVFQEFSRRLKGEIDSNPELKKSLDELKEKADIMKNRTKETTEQLYKHVDTAREEAEQKAKQVSAAVKERVTEAAEQVKGTVESINFRSSSDEKSAGHQSKIKHGAESTQNSKRLDSEAEAEARRKIDASSGGAEFSSGGLVDKIQKAFSRASYSATAALNRLQNVKLIDVATKGYNVLKQELNSTAQSRAKAKAREASSRFVQRSDATAMVPVIKHKPGWKRRLDYFKDKAASHPIFQRLRTVTKHPVVTKSHEIAEDIRERWETSDSPVVHKIQDINDSLFGETATAVAMKEIRARDPSFSLPDFIMELQEEIRPVLVAYLKGDIGSLRRRCSREVVDRCQAERRALESQGIFLDNKILFISDVEVKEIKLVGNVPIIIISVTLSLSLDLFGVCRVEAIKLSFFLFLIVIFVNSK